MTLNHNQKVRLNGRFSIWGVFCSLFFLFLITSQLSAEPAFQFHTLDKQQGLASSVVYDIAQDGDGFIWFATEDGLQKYDGFEFTSYRHSRLDKNSLSNNVVRSLLIGKEGRLWVGTDDGLNLYQKEYDNFKHIPLSKKEGEEQQSNRVRELYQSSDGVLWVGTVLGLAYVNRQNEFVKSYPQIKVRSIFEDDRKQLWIGTLGGGLYIFDRISEDFQQVNEIVSKDNGSIIRDKLSEEFVIDIFQDTFGRLLVATWGKGVYRVNVNNRNLVKYEIDLPSDFVRSIHQDENSHLWFGTKKGILIHDTIDNNTKIIRSEENSSISLKSEEIFKIFQSLDKTVWVGTWGGGVSRHYPSSRKFEAYGKNRDHKLGLSDPVIFAMSENRDGDVWIGSEQGKLTKFYSRTQEFQSYQLTMDDELFRDMIRAIHEFNDELLLIGTASGLYTYQLKRGIFKKYLDEKGEHINDGDAVTFISRDMLGRIWIAFKSNGVISFDTNKNLELPSLNSFSLDVQSPMTFLNIDKNTFMIGTEGFGLHEVKISDSDINLRTIPGTENLNILGTALDWNGQLWVATWTKGIKVFSQGKKVRSIDEDVGLPNNTVYSVLADRVSKKIWATTNVGLVSIDGTTFELSRFGFQDGLQGDEFNRPGFVARNGDIYFGGLKGFNRFYPNLISDELFLHSPKIIGLSVANKKIKSSQRKSADLNRLLLVSESIDLQFDQTPFSFEFTSPQFIKPKELEFRYRLLGLDNNWITALKNSRRATYTNISPGDYVFELQVRSINAKWESEIQRRKITVHPPIWLTNIAKLIYVMIISSIMIMFFYLNWKRRQADFLTQKTVEESEKRLKLSLWGGGNEIWDWNLVTGEVLRSDADKNININCSILSRNLKELSHYIHQYDVERVRRELQSHLSGETDFFDSAYRIKDAKLGWRWIQDRAKVVERDENNAPTRMSGTQRDVSEIHRKDAEIERLGQAFRTTSDGVWIRDEKWRLIECNPSYEKITGFTFTEKKGEELWFPDVAEQQANIIQRIRLSLMEKGNWQGEVWAERKESDPFPQKLTIDTILDEKGYVRYYVGVFSDITFHKRAEEEFRKLANFDSLTGLPNRACLYDRLNQTINKTKIRKERFAILVIDIDNFKRVNDSLGHNVGDTLISEVAKRLTRCNREEDTIARVGGDEFVIIRDGIRSATEVASFAEVMLKELNMPVFIKGQKLNLNFSIGITLSPEDGLTAEKLLRNADTAMYEAKKEVLNSYHFYSIELNQRARKKLALENDLRSAIDEGTIDLAYQPKVDMKTGRVCGMEALARWNHPKFGFVSPEEFISLAEETGLILSLGHQLLRKAIILTKQWVDSGIMRGRMCVNLSAHQFWHRDLASEVSAILKEVGLDSKYLELELTESACIQELDQTVEQMLALRKLGIHLALDDFGTGYSSLAQLKTLPLDTLKVDKSFIQNIQNSAKDANIVKAIIDIANSLELSVVIEGVETKQQCDYLWQSRASIIQGFFFSKPVNDAAMSKLLDKKWTKSSYLSNIAHNVTPLG